MQKITKIMAGLDLTEMDDTLIRYAAFLCRVTEIEKIYFMHVERSLELPPELQQKVNSGLPPDEAIKQEMMRSVQKHFGDQPGIEVEFKVVEGSPLKELAHWAKIKMIDLVLVGKKLRLKGSGVIPQKLARIGRYDIIFVPENADGRINRILVPVDFSEYSREALERAISMATYLNNATVTVLHVFNVPVGHYKIGLSYDEMGERIRQLSEDKITAFLNTLPARYENLQVELVPQNDEEEASQAAKAAADLNTDLVVIGAKGQTALSVFMLGSFTENLLKQNLAVPLLIIKKKNEELGFLDTLFIE